MFDSSLILISYFFSFWTIFKMLYVFKHLCRYQFDRLPSPPGLTPGPLIFSVKIPAPETVFQCNTPAPGSRKRNKIPTPGIICPLECQDINEKETQSSFFPNFHLTIFFYCENNVFASRYTPLRIEV